MAKSYTRQENADWWREHLRRLINEGEQLRPFDSSDESTDLLAHKAAVEGWLARAVEEVSLIYGDPMITAEFCRPLGELDWDKTPRAEAGEFLRREVGDRVEGFRQLMENTA